MGCVAGVAEHRIDGGVARVKTDQLSGELVLRIRSNGNFFFPITDLVPGPKKKIAPESTSI